jgi:hypothetical protein
MGPIEARSVIDVPPRSDYHDQRGIPVLLIFEHENPALPIIVGIIHDTLYSPVPTEEGTLTVERPRDAVIDGRKIVFDAKEEIMLRCGRSSVILRKDGKIVVKGTQIVSRASGTQKIKGASVRIN